MSRKRMWAADIFGRSVCRRERLLHRAGCISASRPIAYQATVAVAAVAIVTACGTLSPAFAQVPNACGAAVNGGVDCKSINNPALATGTFYVEAAAITINVGGGVLIPAAPAFGFSATGGAAATINVAGGVIVVAGGAGYLINAGALATANISAGAQTVAGGVGFEVLGAVAQVNASTGANVVAGGAGYVVTGLGGGPVDGAVVNIGGSVSAGGAGIIATAALGTAVVTTSATAQINAGLAGIIATSGFDLSVSNGAPIFAGLEGIIATVGALGGADFGSSVSVNGAITSGLDGVLATAAGNSGMTVKANSTIKSTSGHGIIVNSESGKVSIVANATIEAASTGKNAVRVNSSGGSDVGIVIENTGKLSAGGDALFVSTTGKVTVDQEGSIISTNGSAINIASAGDATLTLKSSLMAGVDGVNVSGSGKVSVDQTIIAPITAGQDGLKAGSTGGPVTILHNGALTVGRDAIVVTGTGGTDMSTVTSNVAIVAPRNAILATNVNGPLTINANKSLTAQTGIDVSGTGAGGAVIMNLNDALIASVTGVRTNTVAPSVLNIASAASIAVATDLAVEAVTGPITINNDGLVTGFVRLSPGNDTFNNNSSLSWYTHSAGTAGSTSSFGAGVDTLNNAGRIVAARDAAIVETVVFTGLENFNNGDPAALRAGLTTLQDGAVNDTLTTNGTFTGVGNSKVALDSFLGPPGSTSDRLIVGTATAGSTALVINNTNPGPGSYNPVGLEVVDVSAGTTAAQHFSLAGGRIDRGMFFYDLLLRPDNVHVLAGLPGQEAFEMPRIATATQEFWHQTAGVWLDRQSDLRMQLRGNGGQGVAPGPWVQMLGGASKRQVTHDFSLYNGKYSFDAGYLQSFYGFIAGLDGGREEVFGPNDAWLAGVLGGYVGSRLDFTATESTTSVKYAGATVGGYVTYLNQAFFIDTLVKADLLKLDYTAASLRPFGDTADVSAYSLGARIDTGVRFPFGATGFIEPLATVAFVSTKIGDLGVSGATVVFGDDTSLRARLGLRTGGEVLRTSRFRAEASVTTSAWHEFLAKNSVTIVNAGPDLVITDSFNRTFGEVSGAIDFIDLGGGFSGHVKGDFRVSDNLDFWTGRVNLGTRYRW